METAINDRGWSAPLTHVKQIWLTAALPGGRKLYTLCLYRIEKK
jgi:hypothetical protein